MDFEFNEEQKMFREAIRDFAEKDIAPLVNEAEEKERFPAHLFPQMGQLGYLCPKYPAELANITFMAVSFFSCASRTRHRKDRANRVSVPHKIINGRKIYFAFRSVAKNTFQSSPRNARYRKTPASAMDSHRINRLRGAEAFASFEFIRESKIPGLLKN